MHRMVMARNSLARTVGQRPPRRGVRWRLLGPAFVAAIAYVDPGNVVTNTAAGSAHGFLLLWVVVLATLMAGPVQYLSARLGITTGRSLPQHVADHSRSRVTRLAYWGQAELVAVATDIAEIVGAAVALNLLFGMDLVTGGLVAGVVSMGLLFARDRLGSRFFEVVCALCLVTIGACFALGIAQVPPDPTELVSGLLPQLDGAGTVLLAAGIVGATVMPHAVYLHSSLTATAAPRERVTLSERLRATRVDVTTAMVVAGSVNISMLVLGATALSGNADESLEGATAALREGVGTAAGTAFAIALLVSGLASTAVGTQAGAAIMGGLLRRQLPALARRAATLVPALLLLSTGLEPLDVLVLSQVALALGLPFALVPLVTASRRALTPHLGRTVVRVVGVVAAVVIVLDLALVVLTVTGW